MKSNSLKYGDVDGEVENNDDDDMDDDVDLAVGRSPVSTVHLLSLNLLADEGSNFAP